MDTKFITPVKRANPVEKIMMQQIIDDENKFQQQEPGGWDENGDDCPITFKLEIHSRNWQMQAYTPSGKMMDGFHEGFYRCGNCGAIMTWAGEDVIICSECGFDYSEE